MSLREQSSNDSIKLDITHSRKRSMKRVPSLSSNSMGFFEIPASFDTQNIANTSDDKIRTSKMTIMKRRTEVDAALFAEERFETLNQLFPSRTETYQPTSHINRKGSFSMGPLAPHGRRNTEDMEEELNLSKRSQEYAKDTLSYRKLANQTNRWESRWDLIHPHGKFRNAWDMLTLLFIIWVIIYVPFMVAFDVPVNLKIWEWHRIISMMVDCFFLVDVILNFNTGVEIDGSVVMDRKVIAKDYLTSWFWIDILSAAPIDILVLLSGDGSSNESQFASIAKMGRLMRMFKLVRLFRIARVMRVISRIENKISEQEAVRTLWKFFAIVLFYCHIFSCGFYAIGVAYNGEEEWAKGVEETSHKIYAKYVACFYWTIMTTTTIGYGDVSPKGTAQRLFGMLAMVVGALLFGYGVSNVVNIVEELRSSEREFREKMDEFNVYMRAYNMPLMLQDSIREYLKNVRRAQSVRLSMNEEIELITQLSHGLRENIAEAVVDNYVTDMPFFEGEDPSVVMELSLCMERSFMGPEEDVVRCGDVGDEMYFILEGIVEVLIDVKGSDTPKQVAKMGKGKFFGEMALLQSNHVRSATVRTITFCEFRCLSADFFKLLSISYPRFGKSLRAIVGARRREHRAAGGTGVNRPMTRSKSFSIQTTSSPAISKLEEKKLKSPPMKKPTRRSSLEVKTSTSLTIDSLKAKLEEMKNEQADALHTIKTFDHRHESKAKLKKFESWGL